MKPRATKKRRGEKANEASVSHGSLLSRFAIALWALGSVVLVWFASLLALSRHPEANPDDSFIVLVYAKNLAHHGSFFWNRSDGPIDGFTSVLDVWMRTVPFLFELDPIRFSTHLGLFWYVVAALGVGSVTFLVVWSLGRPSWIACAMGTLAAVSVAASDAFSLGGAFFLETQLYASLVVLVIGFLIFPRTSRRWLLLWGLLLLTCALARPEGLAIGAVAYLVFVGGFFGRIALPHLLLPLGPFGIGMVTYTLWHRIRFGYFAPNTYYAKRSDQLVNELSDGAGYLSGFLKTSSGVAVVAVLLFALVAGCFWRGIDARWRRALIAVGSIGLLAIVMTVWEGGDCYPGTRFFAIPVVLAPLAAAIASSALLRKTIPILAIQIVLAAVYLHGFSADAAAWTRARNLSDDGFFPSNSARCEQEASQNLTSTLQPNWRIGQADYQRAKYWAEEANVLDFHGLNNQRIAHLPVSGPVRYGKFEVASLLREDVEVWYPGYFLAWESSPPTEVSGEQLLARLGVNWIPIETIKPRYVVAGIPACGGFLLVLVRRDLAPQLASAGLVVSQR